MLLSRLRCRDAGKNEYRSTEAFSQMILPLILTRGQLTEFFREDSSRSEVPMVVRSSWLCDGEADVSMNALIG